MVGRSVLKGAAELVERVARRLPGWAEPMEHLADALETGERVLVVVEQFLDGGRREWCHDGGPSDPIDL